jgi:hypothetical protein
MFSRYKRPVWLLSLVLALCSSVESQGAKTPYLIGERDRSKEDVVAKVFETLRVEAKLPALIRIRHRSSLEQAVCTVAQLGTSNHSPNVLTAIYKTAQPESISAELSRIALFKEQAPASSLHFPRYSVAVWHVTDSQTGETQYWVGVDLYWSSLEEFVDYHFTDDVFYHNDWKKGIAPQCRGK